MIARSRWELTLLRHAKAESANAAGDAMRPLALRGRDQAAEVGRHLRESAFAPDLVWCSPAIRTRQTWDRVAAKLALPETTDVLHPDWLYYAHVLRLMDELRTLDSRARTVLVVGHEPTMSSLASHLADQHAEPDLARRIGHGIPTATYVRMTFAEPWGEVGAGTGRIDEVFTPQT